MATTLRSTKSITSYVQTCDLIARLAMELKEAQRLEKLLRPEVLEQIGERRSVIVSGIVRTLVPEEKVSVSCAVSDEEIVQVCKDRGLDFQTRSPEYVAGATFAKYVRQDLLPEHVVERKVETLVKIS